MEFRFRAGEGWEPSYHPRFTATTSTTDREFAARPHVEFLPRPGPGPSLHDTLFNPPQLQGGGLVGVGLGVGGEIMRPHAGLALGSLRREMLKEQIREDIIAREMAERRILEEEVLREMEMERSMGIRRVPLDEEVLRGMEMERTMGIRRVPLGEEVLRGMEMERTMGIRRVPLVEQLVVAAPPRVEQQRVVAAPPRTLSVSEGMFSGVRRREVVLQEDSSPPSQVNREVVIRKPPTTVQDDNVSEMDEQQWPVPEVKQFRGQISGVKRKGAAVAGKRKGLRAQDRSLTCALCLVSTTCEEGLKSHLAGKKHQAAIERLASKDTGTRKNSATHSVSVSKVGAAPIGDVAGQAAKKLTMQINGKSHQVIQKKNFLWCEPCGSRCNNTAMMASHLGGKKHLAQMGEVNNDSEPVKEATPDAEAVDDEVRTECMVGRGGVKLTMQIDGKSHQVIQKESFLSCEPCGVRCNSTAMMVYHLGGKKHLTKVGDSEPVEEATPDAEAVDYEARV